MSTVSSTLVFNLADDLSCVVKAELRYDTSDPWAVVLEFDGGVTWEFARDLLADAMTAPAGFGAVRCAAIGGWFFITLDGEDSSNCFRCPTAVILGFLIDTEDVCRFGAEHVEFDDELEQLLKNGAGR